MPEINLLPTNVVVDKNTAKNVQLLTRIAIVFGVIILIEAIVGVSLLFIFNSNLNKAKAENETTLAAVKQLESVELNLVLVKDRLSKIQPILDSRAIYTALERYNSIVTGLPANSTFDGLQITSDANNLTISSPDSDSLASIVRSLSNSDLYTTSIIDNLDFNSSDGFVLTITTN